MKEFISEFFKLQNDRMKSPFFSAVVFSILFYNWDVIYFLISSNSETLSKIDYIKNTVKERSLIAPFLLTGALLILPIVINNIVQWLVDHLTSVRQNRLNKYKIRGGEDELEIAHLEASKSFEPTKIQMQTQNNIDGILTENVTLKASLDDYRQQIEDFKLSLESERNASVESRKHSDFLVKELEEVKHEVASLEAEALKSNNEIITLKELLTKHENVTQKQAKEIVSLKKLISNMDITEDNSLNKDKVGNNTGIVNSKYDTAIERGNYVTDGKNIYVRKVAEISSDVIRRYFPNELGYEIFNILNKTPMQHENLMLSLPKNRYSLGEFRKAVSELINTGMITKTENGMYFSTELGKKAAIELNSNN
uniref:hypothetical protein n=1 Tax=Shewanella baltica TaxID=62322 RepID=UPI0040480DFA